MRLLELMFQNGGHIKMAQNLSTSLFRCYLAKKYKYKTVLKEKLMIGSFFFTKFLFFSFIIVFWLFRHNYKISFLEIANVFVTQKLEGSPLTTSLFSRSHFQSNN
jgi:hypothetical protein